MPARPDVTFHLRRPSIRLPVLHLAVAAAVALPAGLAGATALGPIVEHSALGQPLRIVIDLPGDLGENADARCFAVVPVRDGTDGLGTVASAQTRIERRGGSARLVVSSARPVNDLAVRVAIETTCAPGFRREYTVLLDPPVDDARAAPSVETEAAAPAPVAAPTPAKVRARAKAKRPEPRPPVAADSEGAKEAAARPSPGPNRPASRDRVVVSRTTGVPAGDPGAVERELRKLGPGAQLAALQEQETVLSQRVLALTKDVQAMQQKRIEQLTAQIERMQARLAELEARDPKAPRPVAAAAPATKSPSAPPSAPAAGIADSGLTSEEAAVGGLGGLIVLAGGWMGWRTWRRRRDERLRAYAGEPSILSAIHDAEVTVAGVPPVAAAPNAAAPRPGPEAGMPAYVDYLVLGGVPEDDVRGDAGTRPHARTVRDLGVDFDEEIAETMARRPPGR